MLESALSVHLTLNAFAINFCARLLHKEIVIFLDGSAESEAGGVVDSDAGPFLESEVAVEKEVEAERAHRRHGGHPHEEGVLATGRRQGVGEDEAGVGEAGQAERMLAVETLHLTKAASGGRGGWEELESRDSDGRGREGQALREK